MKLHPFVIRLWLGSAAIGFAQTTTPPAGPGHGGSRGRGPGAAIVRALDTDHNGTLSAAELANAPVVLKALDTNGDASISADELRPPRPANAPTPPTDAPARPAGAGATPRADHPRPLYPIMLALDANSDGALSASEIANATASLLALDLNKDGALTPDEYRPLPPERPANE